MYQSIEYDKIILKLQNYALTEGAKKRAGELKPFLDEGRILEKLKETDEGRIYLERIGTPPLGRLKGMDELLALAEMGGMLLPDQLEEVQDFITASNRMREYLKKGEAYGLNLAGYGHSLYDLSDLKAEIEGSIRGGAVADGASSELRSIRNKIDSCRAQIKGKLDGLLRNKKSLFSDSYVAERNGRFVLPVKKACKTQLPGAVIESSTSGNTLFIEPAAVARLSDELNALQIEEDGEERRILYELTNAVWERSGEIKVNTDALEALDFIYAKAKLSCELDGISPDINCKKRIVIQQGRHPLINAGECVPLDFKIGGSRPGVVITGPNTGGKTVALKTVGLLSAMACAGLHLPCDYADIGINNGIFTDIGDGQSITANLSTFSAHITNVIHILERADEHSLVLLDELGSGTDPAEGMGIAIAILEELRKKQCLFVATTHYPEVKEYALREDGLVNARMAFDRESLKPLYRLEMGEAGESCALYIAKRLGLPRQMLQRAYDAAYNRQTTGEPVPLSCDGDKTGTELEALFEGANETLATVKGLRIQEKEKEGLKKQEIFQYHIGDGVKVQPEGELAIVCHPADEKGEVLVQIKGVKQYIHHKRLQLNTKAEDMYPEDYDFSIIFDTVENRKARKKMGFVQGLEVTYQEGY